MSFLVAPCRDFDGAIDISIGIDHARGLERVNDAEGTIEPAGIILTFEMRAGEYFRASLRAGAKHIADAVDGCGQFRAGKLLDQPPKRLHMGLRKGRLVHAGLVGADGPQRVEIGEHPGAVDGGEIRHQLQPAAASEFRSDMASKF
jgi:hypothetical protein